MRENQSDKQLVFPVSIEKQSGLLGMVTIPLLHSFSGSAGAMDEILMALSGVLSLF